MQTQELMLARIEEIERMDDDQIIQEIAGDVAVGSVSKREYVYEFKMDGHDIQGLSWAGYKELAIRWGNIRIERPIVEDLGDSLRVLVEATDLVHNVTVWAGTHQPKKRKISGREGRPDKFLDDDFAFEKAISKAQRNVVKNIIPHAVQKAAIDSILAGKVIPMGRTSTDASTRRLDQPKQNTPALTEPHVDADEVIQDVPSLPQQFENKGQVHGWYREHWGLNIADIRKQYPEGKGIENLSVQELVEAAERACVAQNQEKRPA